MMHKKVIKTKTIAFKPDFRRFDNDQYFYASSLRPAQANE